jgi:DNA-binding NarL/FixJ family response regulator
VKTRLLIAEDHEILRAGLHALLSTDPDYEVLGEASNGEEAIWLTEKTKPDVVLMDVSMPVCGGLEATRRIKAMMPDVHVLILTVHEDQSILKEALNAGASGYLLKRSLKIELFHAIQVLRRGEIYIHNSLVRQALQPVAIPQPSEDVEKLTTRELEVLKLVAMGNTNTQIAEQLFISKRTVDFHRSNIMSKLNCISRVDLVRYAAEHNLVQF